MEKKKSKKGLIIGIIIGGVVLVAGLITGGVFLVVNLFNGGSSEATAFVDDLKNQRWDAAYEYFLPELKGIQSYEAFSEQINSLKLDESCNYKQFSTKSHIDTVGETKESSGRVECSDKSYSASFKFIKNGDVFKLYSYSIK